MPQALVIPVAAFIGGFGVTAATATLAATIISGAIVGAAIGGLTAAVTGGDIGKGLLYGAVGGAVTGGISGYMSMGSGAATAVSTSANLAQGTASPAILNAAANQAAAGSGGLFSGAAGATGGGLMQGAGASLVNMAGTMMSGSAAEDMAKEQSENETAFKEKQLAAEIEASKRTDETNRIGQTNTLNVARENLAENKAQFDTGTRLDAERLARQQSAVTNARASRQGVLQGGVNKSIDEQAYENQQEVVA